MTITSDLRAVTEAALNTEIRAGHRARLIAVSGIDSSGKGYTASRLAPMLTADGASVVLIGIDGWLNLPQVRFGEVNPGLHFFQNAIRFEEMFAQLIDPLVRDGFVNCEADFTEETARAYRKETYLFLDVDTVLVEGVFLFRRDLRQRYDLKVWVECSFETALRRAVARGQEGLTPEKTIAAFQSIYFPAQKIHFAEDNPQAYADLIFENEHESVP